MQFRQCRELTEVSSHTQLPRDVRAAPEMNPGKKPASGDSDPGNLERLGQTRDRFTESDLFFFLVQILAEK